MKRTITRLFDTRSQAEAAVRELEAMGISQDDLSFVGPSDGTTSERRSFASNNDDGNENETADGASDGAKVGGVVGAGAGLLAGLGMLAIPGLGPVVAAGWLASTAVGAVTGALAGGAAGGILGALKDAGVTDEDAQVYAEGVRRGGTIVAARVDEADAARVEQVFGAQSGVEASTRGAAYRQEGWTGFNQTERM